MTISLQTLRQNYYKAAYLRSLPRPDPMTVPAGIFYLLLEDSVNFLLLETGFMLILEY